MGPKALQAGQHVAVLRQLNLCLGLGGLGTHGENVENQTGTVQNLYLQFFLYVANLLRCKLVIKDDHTDFAVIVFLVPDILFNLFKLALADIRHLTGTLNLLREALHGDSSRCVGQKLQLVEIFFRLGFVLLLGDKSHKNGSLSLDFRDDKFLHTAAKIRISEQKSK